MAKNITEMQIVTGDQTLTWDALLILLKTLGNPDETSLKIEVKKQLIAGLNTLDPKLSMELVSPQLALFTEESEFTQLINKFLARCQFLVIDPLQPKLVKDNCSLIIDFLNNQSQSLIWQHVSSFIRGPSRYLEMLKSISSSEECREAMDLIASYKQPRRFPLHRLASKEINELMDRGKTILKALLERIAVILTIRNQMQPATQRPSLDNTVEMLLKILAIDTAFLETVSSFNNDAEQTIKTMVEPNRSKMKQFSDFHAQRGVAWSHSPHLRREIEAAGFVVRPTVMKRDRCLCETCGLDNHAWRAWHNPLSFHNAAAHSKEHLEQLRSQLEAFRKQASQDSQNAAWPTDGRPVVTIASVVPPTLRALAVAAVVPTAVPVATPTPVNAEQDQTGARNSLQRG